MALETPVESTPPRVFISYCWSNEDHQRWVQNLAEELCANGVDVVFDKWDLGEGQDAFAFMEKMVTDENIDKVIIVTDKLYSDKADSRTGGAGVEAQIISAELYGKREQSKFVGVVRERDEELNPYLPTFLKGRIYIGFWDDAQRSVNFEQLIRWIFDKPLDKKPPIGRQPAYLSVDETTLALETSTSARRADDAIRNGRNHAKQATLEYFDVFLQELKKLALDEAVAAESEQFHQNLENFCPFRDEFLSLVKLTVNSNVVSGYGPLLATFFERTVPLLDRNHLHNSAHNPTSDTFRFLIQELFIHTCAILKRAESGELFLELLERIYVDEHNESIQGPISWRYPVFRTRNYYLEQRNKALGFNLLTLQGSYLLNRAGGQSSQIALMEADAILFLRSVVERTLHDAEENIWFPDSLVGATRRSQALPYFLRARSKKFFEENLAPLLHVNSKDELGTVLKTTSFSGG